MKILLGAKKIAGGCAELFPAVADDGTKIACKIETGGFGHYLLENEWRMLNALKSTDVAPKPIAKSKARSPGSPQDGRYMITMEYIEGVSLVKLAKDHGPLDEQLVAHIAIKALACLSTVHRYGIINRDPHLGNLMCQPNGKLRVIDLGTAMWMGEDSPFNVINGHEAPETVGESPLWTQSSDVFVLASALATLLGTCPDNLPASDFGRFLQACTNPDYTKRPQNCTAALQLLKQTVQIRHPRIQELRFKRLIERSQ